MESLTAQELKLPSESESYTLQHQTDDFATIYDDRGNGFSLFFSDESIKVDPWGEEEFKVYPSDGEFEYSDNAPEKYVDNLENFFEFKDESRATTIEVEETLQTAYDDAMTKAENKDMYGAAETVNDAAQWAKEVMEEEEKKFTNVIMRGDSRDKDVDNIKIRYGGIDTHFGPQQSGERYMEIETSEDHAGEYATPLAYTMGMTILEGEKQKPEVNTGFGHKDKDHHKKGDLCNGELLQACEEVREHY